MADGGASTFIFLVTALLVSGSVSTLLVQQWGEMSDAIEDEQKQQKANSKTSVGFAGDLMEVAYDDSSNPHKITFYLQNTGEYVLDESTLVVLVDGQSVTSSISSTITPTSSEWSNDRLLEVEVSDSSWSFQNDDGVTISVIVSSDVTSGYRGSSSASSEVRLNV